MFGRTPPEAMVTPPRNLLSSSSLRMARTKWRGVTRFFRGREALAACPELVLVQVPTAHGKSDMGIYREYGARVLKIVASVCGGCGGRAVLEKASVVTKAYRFFDTISIRFRVASCSSIMGFG